MPRNATAAPPRRVQIERQRKAARVCERFNRQYPPGTPIYVTLAGGGYRGHTCSSARFIERGEDYLPAVQVAGLEGWTELSRVEVPKRGK